MMWLRRWFVGLMLAACGPGGETPPLADVVVGFCLDVIDSLDGPVCELDEEGERTIRVWLPGGRAVAWIDGAPRPVTSETAVDGGWRVELEVPRGAGALTLTRQDEDNELWRLRFAWTTSMRSSELEQAQAAMQTAFAESASERCRQQAGRAVALATEQRRGPGAMLAARTGAMCSGVEHKREWIAHALQIPEGPDEREVDRAALAAEYFQREGTYQQALDTVNRGLQRALRIGLRSPSFELLVLMMVIRAEMGDFATADAINVVLTRLSTLNPNPCVHASGLLNLAWIRLQQAERTPGTGHEAIHEALRRGEALVAAGDCRREEALPFLLNTVRTLQLDHAWPAANAELDRLARVLRDGDDPALHAEFQLLRARQLLAAGEFAAARVSLTAPVAWDDLPDELALEWMLALGEVAEARGADGEAFGFYARAHRMTVDRLQRLPLTGGMQRFLVDRMRGVQRLVALSREQFKDSSGAFHLAREAAGTEARWLAQRDADADLRAAYRTWRDEHERVLIDAWHLSSSARRELLNSTQRATAMQEAVLLAGRRAGMSEALAPRSAGAGELMLLYFPLGGRRILGFGASEGGVQTAEIHLTDAVPVEAEVWSDEALEAWSELLLTPFAAAVDRAGRVVVLPSFGLQALPFHAFPWRGRPLLAHAEVVYSLDLPVRADRRPADTGGWVLVVGDPLGDLGGARTEAEGIVSLLGTSGLNVSTLIGPSAAGPAVRADLSRARHFHYAGHSASAGPFGWASTLRLAHDTSLSIADIVALERVPRTVVLLSCEAGYVSHDPRAQGISLAAAFVFAGSEAVLAMATPVDEGETPLLAAAFRGEVADGPALSMMYRTGLLHLQEGTLSQAAWQGLRLWVP